MAEETSQTDVPADTVETEQPKDTQDGKPILSVKVYAPFQVYFEGNAYSVSAINATGPFDVLPHHHNFLCMLVPSDLVIEGPNGRKVIKVSRALLHVNAGRVVVFMNV